jgi:DNA-binding IclR family transcriptional regulator
MNRFIIAPRQGTQSLQRAALLLRELSTRLAGGWTLTELATQCGLDRTTTHRMLDCLTREGLVSRQGAARNYMLGPLAFELGLAAAPRFDPRINCNPSLQRIRDRTGDTVFLNVRSGTDTVCIDRLEGHASLKALVVEVGARRSLVSTAGGVAILLALPPAERRRIVQACVAHLRRADAAHREGIARMLRRSEQAGYGLNCDDIIPGISAIAVALVDAFGAPIAAITLASTSDRLDERRRRKTLDVLTNEARKLADRLSPAPSQATCEPRSG